MPSLLIVLKPTSWGLESGSPGPLIVKSRWWKKQGTVGAWRLYPEKILGE
jgi:hypothetical protein